MKKSKFIKLVFVSGLLGTASLSAESSASPATNTYSNCNYLRTGVGNAQDTIETRLVTHSFVSIPRGGFGFFGHHGHVAG